VYTYQKKNVTLFIMGFNIPEIKTPVPPNARNSIICRDVKLYQLGSKFIKTIVSDLSDLRP